jgi:hypothetical protein
MTETEAKLAAIALYWMMGHPQMKLGPNDTLFEYLEKQLGQELDIDKVHEHFKKIIDDTFDERKLKPLPIL